MKKIMLAVIVFFANLNLSQAAPATWDEFCKKNGIGRKLCECAKKKTMPKLEWQCVSLVSAGFQKNECLQFFLRSVTTCRASSTKVAPRSVRRRRRVAQPTARRRRSRVARRVRRQTRTTSSIRNLVVRQDIVRVCNTRLNLSEVKDCINRYEFILKRYVEPYKKIDASASELRQKLREYKQLYLRLTSAKGWKEFGLIISDEVCGLRKYAVGKHKGYRRLNRNQRQKLHNCIRALYRHQKQRCKKTLKWLKSQKLIKKYLKKEELETMTCSINVIVKGFADWRRLDHNMTLAGNRRGDLIQAVYAALGGQVQLDYSAQHEIGEYQYERATKMTITARIKNLAVLSMLLQIRQASDRHASGPQKIVVKRKTNKLEQKLKELGKKIPKDFNKWKRVVEKSFNDLWEFVKNLRYPVQIGFSVGYQGWWVLDSASKQSLGSADQANPGGLILELELKVAFNWSSRGFFGANFQINPIPTDNRFGDGVELGIGTFVGGYLIPRRISLRVLFRYRWSRVNARQTRVLGQDFLTFGVGGTLDIWRGIYLKTELGYQLGLWRSTVSHGIVFNVSIGWHYPL